MRGLKRRPWRLSIVTFLSLLLGTLVGVPMAAVMYLGFGTAAETATTLIDTRSSMIRAQLVGRTRNFLSPAEQVPTFLGRVIDGAGVPLDELGPLECEEFFTLPPAVVFGRPAELTRFAILPAYRKGSTFLPIVAANTSNTGKHSISVIGWRTRAGSPGAIG